MHVLHLTRGLTHRHWALRQLCVKPIVLSVRIGCGSPLRACHVIVHWSAGVREPRVEASSKSFLRFPACCIWSIDDALHTSSSIHLLLCSRLHRT